MKNHSPWSTFPAILVAALAVTAVTPAQAVPITVTAAGYWLETIGPNTVGIGTGTTTVTRTLFVADLASNSGTTATAMLNGAPTHAPYIDVPTIDWIRTERNPSASDLAPLYVTFHNGSDTATVVGRDLSALTPLALVSNISVDSSVDPFGPTVHWTLPVNSGNFDAIQVDFYNDDTNQRVGSRFTFTDLTTNSFDIYGPGTGGLLPLGYHLTVDVRLVDLFDNAGPVTLDNISRESRAYINYTTPSVAAVPEPSTFAFLAGGLGMLAVASRHRKGVRNLTEHATR